MEVCPDDGARLIETDVVDRDDPLIGTLFDGRFKIVGKLGEGGMGAVYSARRLDFETDVALKLLKGDFTANEDIRKRFMYEARVISNLKHPHAIQVFDFGQSDEGHVYMVMELLEGESLADRLSYRFLSYREIFDIIPPICGVLGEAHTRDVIHRDLKPENIYLLEVDGNEEFPKLLDFGIAKHNRAETMTKSGTLWGTPAYMSPEQAQGASVKAPADIYGIGIMLYELISGNLPFHATTQMGYAVKHIKSPVRPVSSIPGLDSVPRKLDEFLVQMLAKEPQDRPPSMEVVADTLNRVRDEHFDQQLLDSVPAKEVDPIRLQRWLEEEPDVSGELPAPAQEPNGASEALAETSALSPPSRVETGDGVEVVDSAGEDHRTLGYQETPTASGSEQPSSDGERTDQQRQMEEAPTVALRTGREPTKHIQSDDIAPGRARRLGLVAAAGIVLLGVGVAAAILLYDAPEEPDETIEPTVEDLQAAQQQDPAVEPGSPEAPLEPGEAVASAASQAFTVVLQTHEIVRELDPEDADEELEAEFDFLYDADALEQQDYGEETDERRRLEEALEETF